MPARYYSFFICQQMKNRPPSPSFLLSLSLSLSFLSVSLAVQHAELKSHHFLPRRLEFHLKKRKKKQITTELRGTRVHPRETKLCSEHFLSLAARLNFYEFPHSFIRYILD